MHDLVVLPEFQDLPHQRVPRSFGQFGSEWAQFADFSRLPVHAPFVAMMPQWHFPSFLEKKAKDSPGFRLIMSVEGYALLTEEGHVRPVPDAQCLWISFRALPLRPCLSDSICVLSLCA